MRKIITEEEFMEGCLKFAPPNSKIVKVEKDGYTFFQIGEPNLDVLAKFLYGEMVKQERKRIMESKKEDV